LADFHHAFSVGADKFILDIRTGFKGLHHGINIHRADSIRIGLKFHTVGGNKYTALPVCLVMPGLAFLPVSPANDIVEPL
jgi:hypothetical protein